jgi:glycosyltransferase involved in cell wall biosynthesis
MSISPSRHIVLISSYLNVPGGYEKIVTNTANLFTENNYRVTLLILDEPATTFYPLHKKIQVIQKKMTFGNDQKGNPITRKAIFLKDIRTLRRLLLGIQPDIIVASEYYFAITSILAGAKKFAKIFSWEHHHYGVLKLNRFWRILRQQTYPHLNAVITLNEDERNHYSKLNKNVVVISNFISQPSRFTRQTTGNYILTVTRFNHIKGFDLLLKVAERVFGHHSTIKWKIIGYGEQEKELLQFILEKKLSDRFIYVPASDHDITTLYLEANFFVLTSRNECFPMVLLEAQSFGLPCIAFDCETGPRHIIEDNKNGLLIEKENVQQMAEAIIKLWNNKTQQKDMSRSAFNSVQRFYADSIFKHWKSVFEK